MVTVLLLLISSLCCCSSAAASRLPPVHPSALQAGNVMLTSMSNGVAGRVWSVGGGRQLTAKVADFGLAMPLGPTDTHATLLARVSGAP